MNQILDPCAIIAARVRFNPKRIIEASTPYRLRKLIGYEHRPSEFGRLLCQYHPNGHRGQPFNPASIWKFENEPGRYPGRDTCEAYRAMLETILRKIDPALVLDARFYSQHWQFRAKRECSLCHNIFYPKSFKESWCYRHNPKKGKRK